MSSRGRHIWDLLGLTEFQVQIFSLVNDVWSKYHNTPESAQWDIENTSCGPNVISIWKRSMCTNCNSVSLLTNQLIIPKVVFSGPDISG